MHEKCSGVEGAELNQVGTQEQVPGPSDGGQRIKDIVTSSKEEWGIPLCLPGRRHIPLPGGEEQDKAGLCSPKGQACCRGGPGGSQKGRPAAGAEVTKRQRRRRLVLFGKPQRGLYVGAGKGRGVRSVECSHLTSGPELSQLQKQGRDKSRNSKGWWGVNGAYHGSLTLALRAMPFSGRVGRLQPVSKGSV